MTSHDRVYCLMLSEFQTFLSCMVKGGTTVVAGIFWHLNLLFNEISERQSETTVILQEKKGGKAKVEKRRKNKSGRS